MYRRSATRRGFDEVNFAFYTREDFPLQVVVKAFLKRFIDGRLMVFGFERPEPQAFFTFSIETIFEADTDCESTAIPQRLKKADLKVFATPHGMGKKKKNPSKPAEEELALLLKRAQNAQKS